jgi:hypothetical protein
MHAFLLPHLQIIKPLSFPPAILIADLFLQTFCMVREMFQMNPKGGFDSPRCFVKAQLAPFCFLSHWGHAQNRSIAEMLGPTQPTAALPSKRCLRGIV